MEGDDSSKTVEQVLHELATQIAEAAHVPPEKFDLIYKVG